MHKINLRCYGKINLALDITGKRSDGYHEIDTIMASVGIYDTVQVCLDSQKAGIYVACDGGLPCDESNIAYRAAQLMQQHLGISDGIMIRIRKNIPQMAGMGGGSADAAGVMAALNRLCDAQIPADILAEWSLALGADVPFMFYGGTCRCRGIGEKIEPIPAHTPLPIVVIQPEQGFSTGRLYGLYDEMKQIAPVELEACQQQLLQDDPDFSVFENVFHYPTACFGDCIEQIRQALVRTGAKYASMTGSGSAVYGIYANTAQARRTARALFSMYPFVRQTVTMDRAYQISSFE